MHPSTPGPPSTPAASSAGGAAAALARGADLAVRAPSVHHSRPWLLEVHADRLVVRADRSRQLTALERAGRELVQSVGAAVFTVRVGLAAEGWGADVDRLPDPGDPDLLAVVRPVAAAPDAAPDAALAALAPAVSTCPGGRWGFGGAEAPDVLLRTLAAAAADEGVQLLPVAQESHRRLVARLAGQAGPDRETAPLGDQMIVLLATPFDTPLAWLQCGEAVQRVLLALTLRNWTAGPVPQVIEVPLARTQLRSALSWDAHPQLLLRLGPAGPALPARRGPHRDVVLGGAR